MQYREFSIKKKSGKLRKICAPNSELKKYQRGKLYMLQKLLFDELKGTDIWDTQHGFIRGRNCVTAAKQHIGFKTTIQMDLSDFFDTVKPQHMPQTSPLLRDPRLYHNKEHYAAQGFSTSPLLANIAAIPMLKEINATMKMAFDPFILTLYADDISLSVNTEDYDKINTAVAVIGSIIEKHGFKVNKKKTRIKYAKFGWRRILGINVGDTEIRATRKVMRRIRAARVQGNKSSLGGLVTWSKCIEPKKPVKSSEPYPFRGANSNPYTPNFIDRND